MLVEYKDKYYNEIQNRSFYFFSRWNSNCTILVVHNLAGRTFMNVPFRIVQNLSYPFQTFQIFSDFFLFFKFLAKNYKKINIMVKKEILCFWYFNKNQYQSKLSPKMPCGIKVLTNGASFKKLHCTLHRFYNIPPKISWWGFYRVLIDIDFIKISKTIIFLF